MYLTNWCSSEAAAMKFMLIVLLLVSQVISDGEQDEEEERIHMKAELHLFEKMFNNYTITTKKIVEEMELFVENITESANNFLLELNNISMLKPVQEVEHGSCDILKNEINTLKIQFKIEISKLESPILTRILEIRQKLVSVASSITLYHKLVDSKYQNCLLYNTSCESVTKNWLKETLALLKCEIIDHPNCIQHSAKKKRSANEEYLCPPNQFTCNNGECISGEYACNGYYNCQDESDENDGCTKFCFNGFHCRSLECINKGYVCDGSPHCSDGSDEEGCPKKQVLYSRTNCSLESGEYLCKNRKCVSIAEVCDGRDDCGDGSDEGGECDSGVRCSGVCERAGGTCLVTPLGASCLSVCPPGLVDTALGCRPSPLPPAPCLAQLLDDVPRLAKRYSASVYYLKRNIITKIKAVVDKIGDCYFSEESKLMKLVKIA